MILTVKKDCDRNELQRLMNQLEKKGLELNFSEGANYIVLGLVGDTDGTGRRLAEKLYLCKRSNAGSGAI